MKKMNKKGFSLVELMIVVVIMGILVAVAIPVYGGIRENSEARTCGSNQRLIRNAFHNWVLMDNANNNGDTLFVNGARSFNGKNENPKDVFDPDFLELFDDGKLPACPVHDSYYVVKIVDGVTIEVECYDENGTLRTTHEEKQ